MKSIVGILEVQNLPFLAYLEALNLNDFLHFFKAEIRQIEKIQSPKNGKRDSFLISTLSKIDFT